MIKEPGDEVNILSKRVIGIAIDVHRALGPGYTESIYEKALCMEFDSIGMPYVNQLPIEVVYIQKPG
ncbi:MAG: GxxExxY protein [Blastocatellales bacterium]|mgnify:CR=1 FL=1